MTDGSTLEALLHTLDQYIIFIGFRFRQGNVTYKDLNAEDKKIFDKKFAQPVNTLETVLRSVMEPKLNKGSKTFDRSKDVFDLFHTKAKTTR